MKLLSNAMKIFLGEAALTKITIVEKKIDKNYIQQFKFKSKDSLNITINLSIK